MNASRMASILDGGGTFRYPVWYSLWYCHSGMAGRVDVGMDAPFNHQSYYDQLRRSHQPTGQTDRGGTLAPSSGNDDGAGGNRVLARHILSSHGHWQKISQPSWQERAGDSYQAPLNRRFLARLLRSLGRAVLSPDFKIPPPPPLPPDLPPPSKSDEALRKKAIRELALLRYELNEVLSVIDHKAPPDEP